MGLEEYDFRFAYDFAERVVALVRGTDEQAREERGYYLPSEPVSDFVTKAAKPQKRTLLHEYIYSVIVEQYEWDIGHGAPEDLIDMRGLFIAANRTVPEWMTPEHLVDHLYDLDREMRMCVDALVPATFHILFSDLRFLQDFQDIVSELVSQISAEEFPIALRSVGVLRRPRHIPVWLKKAIFHRDKGRCQACLCDLTGVIALGSEIHIDHIRPLARSGSNDPTNFQLLCEPCNKRKGAREVEGRWRTQTYW